MNYEAFLANKRQLSGQHGFVPLWMPEFLFPFQASLVEWALTKGRAAIFADCGLGKTPMQLVWAQNVVQHTNRPVLIACPLAVSYQVLREAEKFGIEAVRSIDGTVPAPATIVVTNYERLERFTASDFAGLVCDESSILKNFDGTRRKLVQEFMRLLPYRLLCTATAAPNDYVEIGTSSEALGELGHLDMLARFFKNIANTSNPRVGWRSQGGVERTKWRFRGHAEQPFWRWVASWARALRRPSDLGFSDDAFRLPPLEEVEHVVEARTVREGMLFNLPAVGLQEEREERRRTLAERCEMVARLVEESDQALIWCHLNAEGDLLERLIPDSIQVKGSDPDEFKELAAEWFIGIRCVCNEPLFRAKLSAWRSNPPSTGSGFTESTENSCSLAPKSTALGTQNGGDDIIEPTTARTKTSGKGPGRSKTNITPDVESNTRLIPTSVAVRLRKCGNIGNATPTPDSRGSSHGTVSVSKPTGKPLAADAPSASARLTSISGAVSDSTSTIAMPPGASGAFSAPPAISGLASSATTPSFLSGPQCICGHISGRRRLISKPVMFGYGLNLQNCAHIVAFPSHSYEQYYQGIRRCWRFGQTRPVRVDLVATKGERAVVANLHRKAAQAERMFAALVAHMTDALSIAPATAGVLPVEVPAWL